MPLYSAFVVLVSGKPGRPLQRAILEDRGGDSARLPSESSGAIMPLYGAFVVSVGGKPSRPLRRAILRDRRGDSAGLPSDSSRAIMPLYGAFVLRLVLVRGRFVIAISYSSRGRSTIRFGGTTARLALFSYR